MIDENFCISDMEENRELLKSQFQIVSFDAELKTAKISSSSAKTFTKFISIERTIPGIEHHSNVEMRLKNLHEVGVKLQDSHEETETNLKRSFDATECIEPKVLKKSKRTRNSSSKSKLVLK